MDEEQTFTLGQHVIPRRYPNLGCGSKCTVVGIYTNERGPLYDVEYVDAQCIVRTNYFKPAELLAA